MGRPVHNVCAQSNARRKRQRKKIIIVTAHTFSPPSFISSRRRVVGLNDQTKANMSFTPSRPNSHRPVAPPHSHDRNYEATRPQRGESLYEWATKDYFKMGQREWINHYTMIEDFLLVKPKVEKFMLTAKVADEDCERCAEINRTRNPGEPKIPCIVSHMEDRCALCIVTKQNKHFCQSQLPANYPWNSSNSRRSRAHAVPPKQNSPSSPPPRATSPAWTFDNIGDQQLPKDQFERPQTIVSRRSASPVRQTRYYHLEAPTEPSNMRAQRKRRQSVSAVDVAEDTKRKRFLRASTVGPGPDGDDDGSRNEGQINRENQQSASTPAATSAALISAPPVKSDIIVTPKSIENGKSNASTPSHVDATVTAQSSALSSTSTTMSNVDTPLSSSDSVEDIPLANVSSASQASSKATQYSLFFEEILHDFKLKEEKIKGLESVLREEQKKSEKLQAGSNELKTKVDRLQEKLKRVQENDGENALLKAENKRLQAIVDQSNQAFDSFKSRIKACLEK